MKTMVIKTNGECEEHDHQFKYEEINAACGGFVDGIRLSDGMYMFVNDVGLIQEGFEPNLLATMVTVAGGYHPQYLIMGDVVLMREEGYDEEFPDNVLEVIKYIKVQYRAKVDRSN